MDQLPRIPRSLTSIRKIKAISPASTRMLKQLVITKDSSKFIDLSSTTRYLKSRPVADGLELSYQLTTLRKNLDKYYLQNFEKMNQLRELKTALKQLKDSEIVSEEDVQKKNYYHKLKKDIKTVEMLKLQELEDQKICMFMLERMRYMKKFLEKKEKKLRKQLDYNVHDAEVQGRLKKETFDTVNNFKTAYKAAVDSLEYEKNSFLTEISRMEAQSVMKKSMIAKTEEHNRHRLEIVEQTMIEERSAHLEVIRNALLLNKMFYKILSKKLVSVKKSFEKFEDAFQRIRIHTGLNNVSEVIEKFLTQEASYAELVETLQRKELECNDYKDKIRGIQENVQKLSNEKVEKKGEGRQIQTIVDKIIRSKEYKEEISKMFLKINVWVESIVKKFGKDTQEGDLRSLSLKEKFIMLKGVISSLIHRVKQSDENPKNIKMKEIIDTCLSLKKDRLSIVEKSAPLKNFSRQKALL